MNDFEIEQILKEFDEWRIADTEACLLYINAKDKGTPDEMSISFEDEQQRIIEWWRNKLKEIA